MLTLILLLVDAVLENVAALNRAERFIRITVGEPKRTELFVGLRRLLTDWTAVLCTLDLMVLCRCRRRHCGSCLHDLQLRQPHADLKQSGHFPSYPHSNLSYRGSRLGLGIGSKSFFYI